MLTARRTLTTLTLSLLMLPVTPSIAQTGARPAVPGAMPNDKVMTCQMISAERAGINEAVAKKAQGKVKSAKLKKGLFGFAKGMAAAMVPGAAVLGGGSMIGSLAAQGASQSAAQALAGAGSGQTTPVAAAEPTPEQTARLARLDSIGAYRQCQPSAA
jgi:hypothetical protein